jgi:sarcosine oxidase subunit beta
MASTVYNLATAFSGSGFKIAPAVGTCLAELIVEGRAKTVNIAPFGLTRFAEGRSPQGPHPYAERRDQMEPLNSASSRR